jgi:RimJ/RimL family protein N-acetyltransferase
VSARVVLELADGAARLRAFEPTPAQVAAAAPRLAAFYNEPHNRAMLAHTADLDVSDVVAHYARLARPRGYAFLLERDGALVGDADLRRVERERAEAAILVGERAAQGQGLGLRFGVMLHAFAFRAMGLPCVYASIIPANEASLRLFGKLGYERDDTPVARGYADEVEDVTLSLTRETFEARHRDLAARVDIQIARRPRA